MGYKKTERIIKFKRAYFYDADCKEFSHIKEWGVNIGDSIFDTPSSNNFAPYFIDLQYIEIAGKEICEGDILKNATKTAVVLFVTDSFVLQEISKAKGVYTDISYCEFMHIVGNIYENSDLLN